MSTEREDARDRMLLSIADALTAIMVWTISDQSKLAEQIAHNLAGCSKDLMKASGLKHGRPSDWRDVINGQ